MNPALLATAEQLLIDRVLSNKAPMMGNAKVAFNMLTLSGVVAAVGFGFLIYAAFIWLSNNYAPDIAAAIAGAATLSLAFIIALCSVCVAVYKQKRIKKFQNDMTQTLQDTLSLVSEEIAEPIRENPKSATILAILTGYMIREKLF